MVFSDLAFIYVFLPLLFILYYPVKNTKWRNGVLIVFSLLFYAFGEIRYILLLISVVLINYVSSLFIAIFANKKEPKKKKLALVISVILNLGLLAFFKYFGLFEEIINIFAQGNVHLPEILLPLGISFFIFQSMSYTFDVYRGDVKAQLNFFKLMLYVSLFPQLIAGPIVRYKDVCEQIDGRTVTLAKVNSGIFRFAQGLAKKVIIANACGSVSGTLLDSPLASSTVMSAWIGILFFALQIYFDFSGYSDMAIGLGRMLGFEFLENFNYPYVSSSATEFWRRWHMSLGTFFRDYVYIPLGGNRRMWLRNVIVVWMLTGMWHGASINFIIWGLYYGLLLIIEKKAIFPLQKNWPEAAKKIFGGIYMLFVTLFGWTLFYYTDGLWDRIRLMFGGGVFAGAYEFSLLRSNIFLLIAAMIFATPAVYSLARRMLGRIREENRYMTAAALKTAFVLITVLVCTMMLAGDSYNPFLYFRF